MVGIIYQRRREENGREITRMKGAINISFLGYAKIFAPPLLQLTAIHPCLATLSYALAADENSLPAYEHLSVLLKREILEKFFYFFLSRGCT